MKADPNATAKRVKNCKCYCVNCSMNYCGRCDNHTSEELMSLVAVEDTQGLIKKDLLL